MYGINMNQDDYMNAVRAELDHYDGNMSSFARHMATIIESISVEANRYRLRSIANENPDFFPRIDKIDYDAHIPKVWDGELRGLARLLNRRFPEISTNGWEHRIRRAHERNAISEFKNPDFIVNQLKKETQTVEDLWATIEAQSKKAIEATEDARWATVHIKNSDRYIGIAFQSDQHIGNSFCDHERLRKDTELIVNHPDCYVIHAGDYIDNFIIDKPRPAMKARIPPSVQWRLCEHYINMSAPSLMAVVAGNHDLWTSGMTDFDPLKKMVEEHGVLYHQHELNLRLIHGKVAYHLSIRHKRRGNSNLDPSRVVKKMWDDGECDFDVGVIGHHHTPSVVPFTRHGVERWSVRPGAYKIIDTFGEMCGFPRERPTSPMIILDPETRDIQAFTDLRHGLRMLNALNGRDANAYLDEQ